VCTVSTEGEGAEFDFEQPGAGTDVAPNPIETTVPVKQRVELVTFHGSPSSAFKPKVSCSLQ
jgi:hypothetical protein